MSLEQLSKAELIAIIERQAVLIEQLTARVTELEKQLGKNSHNSNKPPSSDGLKKVRRTKSERKPSGKSSGGQPGHSGHHLPFSNQPDLEICYPVSACSQCGTDLSSQPVRTLEKRQVWDLPPLSLEVTEHQAEQKQCPCCRSIEKGTFPDQVRHRVQYGSGVQSLLVYLHHGQLLPYERTIDVMRDLFGQTISQGTLSNILQRTAASLEPEAEEIRSALLQSPVVHMDETGIDVLPKRQWAHVYSTPDETFYALHPKRGCEAMNAIGFLPAYKGIAIHDEWPSYFTYTSCLHGLCNAHILRELTYLHEQEKQPWAYDLHELLVEMKKAADLYGEAKLAVPEKKASAFVKQYRDVVWQASDTLIVSMTEHQRTQRKSLKRTPARKMLDRLIGHEEKILRFLHNPKVPFDNNQAERDLRMIRVKEKISGLFRSEKGAQDFMTIRSFLSTVRKQGLPLLNALKEAIEAPYVFS
jgi:transposase